MTLAGNKLLTIVSLFLITILSLYPCSAQGSEKPVKPITDYPMAKKIWLSLEDGLIQAADQKIYRVVNDSYVTLLKPNGSKLEKGEVFAIVDPNLLELEKRSLDLEKSRFDQKLKDLKTDQQQLRRKQNEEIQALETKKIELKLSLNVHEVSKKLTGRIQEAIKDLDVQINELKSTIDPERLEEDLQMAEEELKIALDLKIRAFDQLERRSKLKAEFPGTLNLLIENPDDTANINRPIWIDVSSAYASIVNDKNYEMSVPNRNPIFNEYPKEQLVAVIDDIASKKLTQTTFQETRKVEINGAFRDQHIFKFSEEDIDYAEQNIGETRTIFIYLLLKKEAYMVNKNDIALIAPEILEKSGWKGLVEHLYPGYKVLHIGPKTLAVSK